MGHVTPPSLPPALTACPDCAREISRQARHCVHCGRPWPVRHPLVKAFWVGIIGLVALAAGSAAAIVEASRHPELPKLKNGGAGSYTDASIRPSAGSEHR